jgi:fused signal recognition particle receptor
MFDLLKKKITSFIGSLLEKKEREQQAQVETRREEKVVEALPETEQEKKEEKVSDEAQSQKKIERKKEIKEAKEEKKHEIKLGIVGQIKSFFTGEVEIARSDVEPLLQNFELDLLEADVSIDVASEIKHELEKALVGKKIRKGELNAFVKNTMKEVLFNIVKNEKSFDLVERMKCYEQPVKIMFIGPNGSGKTTTISKVAKMLMDNNYTVVFGAADTFRAAAVEQISVHADRLGVKTIKRPYGADPTAVAYDAVNYAKAHGINAVLIDTAGRQETNMNLINELKKMDRVIKPHLKIYVGESISGNVITEQIRRFNKEIGIDGIILTKLDCDPKGGTVLSISKITGIPIIYVGTGQSYDDLEKFDPQKIVERIIS